MVLYCLIKWIEYLEYLEWTKKNCIKNFMNYFEFIKASKIYDNNILKNNYSNNINNFLK